MSQWRNVSNDERGVLYGNPRPQLVVPDGVTTVDDDADVAYAHQSDIWGPADDGAKAAVAALNPKPAPAPVKATAPASDAAVLEAKVASDEAALAEAEKVPAASK